MKDMDCNTLGTWKHKPGKELAHKIWIQNIELK